MSESHEHARAGLESGVCPTCGQQVKVVADRQGHSPSGAAGGGASKEEMREKAVVPDPVHYLACAAIIGVTLLFFLVWLADSKNRFVLLFLPFGLAATVSLVIMKEQPRLGMRLIQWTVIAMVTVAVCAGGFIVYVLRTFDFAALFGA